MYILYVQLFYIFVVNSAALTNIDDPEIRLLSSNIGQPNGNLNRRIVGRITNGTIVNDLSQFAYQVGIFSTDDKGSILGEWCGGSLISREWILTAAHCLDGKVESLIYIGITDKTKNFQYKVENKNYIIHKYDKVSRQNDIALIKLPVQVELSNIINTITLDKDPSLIKWVNRDAIVSGWGASITGGPTNRYLQYADVKILSNSKCVQAFGSKLVTSSNICQRVIQNKGTCQGDSGGPLAVIENRKPILIGISSYSVKNPRQCEIDIPRVYTRVASYSKWICNNTNKTVC